MNLVTPTLVIGVDPGPTTGIAAFTLGIAVREIAGQMLMQCDAASAWYFVCTMITQRSAPNCLIAIERYVVSTRSARSTDADAARVTREVIAEITRNAFAMKLRHVVERPAVDVKRWGTDQRLRRIGLLEPTKGMPHARDAARHALYAAVHDLDFPDPLSK